MFKALYLNIWSIDLVRLKVLFLFYCLIWLPVSSESIHWVIHFYPMDLSPFIIYQIIYLFLDFVFYSTNLSIYMLNDVIWSIATW